MATDVMFPNARPSLTVEHTGGKQLGNCYSATFYRVTSTTRVSKKSLEALNHAGVLGFGQGFCVKSPCDGKEAPAGHDTLTAAEVDRETRTVVSATPVNRYTGKPYEPIQSPYYVYLCEATCDSGD